MALRAKDVRGLKGVDLTGFQKKGRYPVVEKSRRTMDGIVFASLAEMKRYGVLKLGQRAGMVRDLKTQPAFPVLIEGKAFCTYTADFSYFDERGAFVVEDVKSSGTQKDAAYLLRKKAAELFYGFTVREVVAR